VGTRPVRSLGISLVAASLAATATAARADDAPSSHPPSVAVRASPCRDLPWSEAAWVDVLRVELAADGIGVASATPSADRAPTVALDPETCGASAESATLTFTWGQTRRSRVVALADVGPEARARVLAIAAAELVRAALASARTAASATPAAVPGPSANAAPAAPALRLDVDVRVGSQPFAPVPARTARPEAEPQPPFPIALSLAAEARSFPAGNAGLFGSRVGARWSFLGWSALAVDAGALFGGARDPLGDVDETLASASVSFLGQGGTERVAFGVGPRIEGGVAWFRGRAFDPSTIASSVSSPVLFFALTSFASFRIAGSWSGLAALDVGTSVVSYGARADDRQVARFAGAMRSARTGLAWTP
jgi:hypothetical protein